MNRTAEFLNIARKYADTNVPSDDSKTRRRNGNSNVDMAVSSDGNSKNDNTRRRNGNNNVDMAVTSDGNSKNDSKTRRRNGNNNVNMAVSSDSRTTRNGNSNVDMPISSDGDKMFYDVLCNKIANFNVSTNNYNGLLKREHEFFTLQKETTELFKIVELESNTDMRKHFDGIKKIILLRLADKHAEIQAKKRRFINKNIHLEPERPFVYLKAEGSRQLERENEMIMKETQSVDYRLRQTRKSLQEIKEIQYLINLNLSAQNETIDQIFSTSQNIGQNVRGSNRYLKLGKDRRRLLRRALFVWLLCISFVLMFLHINT